MKRSYQKPALFIEELGFAQTIAGDCSRIGWGSATFGDRSSCGWDLGGGYEVFWDANICGHATREAGGLCYSTPFGGLTVFSS